MSIKGVGNPPSTGNAGLDRYLHRLREALDQVSASAGASSTSSVVISGGAGGSGSTLLDDDTAPPALTGLAAVGLFNIIIVSWDPTTSQYYNYGEVWRSDTDNLGTAVRIGTTSAFVYPDALGGAQNTKYYWVRAMSLAGIPGPYNAVSGVSAQVATDPDYIKTILTDELDENAFVQSLKDRIDLVDGAVSMPGSVNARVDAETSARTAADDAVALDIVSLNAGVGGNAAAIASEASTRSTNDTAIASDVTTLQSTVGGHTSSISTNSTAIATVEGDVVSVKAERFVKLDVDGYVTGHGEWNNGPGASGFVIIADKFAIGTPGAEPTAYPFIVGTVDGVPSVYMDTAYIKEATITSAMVEELAAEKIVAASGTIADILVGTGHIGNAMIGDIIQSVNYNGSTHTGWILNKNGLIEVQGIKIYDDAGNLILASGTGVEWGGITSRPLDVDLLNVFSTWDQISGTANAPADGADVTDYSSELISNNVLENGACTISRPKGGTFFSNNAALPGAMVVTLPQSWTSTMMTFDLNVYLYDTNKTFTLHLGGYNYLTGTTWANVTANLVGSAAENNRVRFGHDGTNCVVVIGNTTADGDPNVWDHPRAHISNFMGGYANVEIDKWDDSWDVTVTDDISGITFSTGADIADSLIDAKAILNQGALAIQDQADWNLDLANRPSDASLLNSFVNILADGTLSGGGGGQVTIVGLGFNGSLDATDNTVTSSASDPTGGVDGSLHRNTATKSWWAKISGTWVKVSDETAANTAANIAGQGSLATVNSADWASQVSGANKPANNADVTSANPQSPGWLNSPVVWSGNPVTAANASTYIADLAVDTLQLAGHAVNLTESAEQIGMTWTHTSWQTLVSKVVSLTDILAESSVIMHGAVKISSGDITSYNNHVLTVRLVRDPGTAGETVLRTQTGITTYHPEQDFGFGTLPAYYTSLIDFGSFGVDVSLPNGSGTYTYELQGTVNKNYTCTSETALMAIVIGKR